MNFLNGENTGMQSQNENLEEFGTLRLLRNLALRVIQQRIKGFATLHPNPPMTGFFYLQNVIGNCHRVNINMNKVDISKIAAKYEDYSSVQRSAAEVLLKLLEIVCRDDVLDLGCGIGNLTRKIREMTS